MINKLRYLFLAVLAALAVGTPSSAGIIQLVPTILEEGGGGDPVTADLFNDNFEGSTTNASPTLAYFNTEPWASLGYLWENAAVDGMSIVDRSDFPAGLLAEPDLHASKNRAIYCNQTQEAQCRAIFEISQVNTVWISWWEYRPNNNQVAEKFMRTGNFLGENRGNDIIWAFGGPVDSGIDYAIAEPRHEMFQQGVAEPGINTGGGALTTVEGLHFYEWGVILSTGTSANGSTELWIDDELYLSDTGLQYFDDLPGSTRGITFVDFGGWPSGPVDSVTSSGGSTLTYTYPLERYLLEVKVSTTRLGEWPMSAD